MKQDNDWQLTTQDDEYLKLSVKRLTEPPLKWCHQVADLINTSCELGEISINDFGCNVGHFVRVIERINCAVDYCGYDISHTYLEIATNEFPDKKFSQLDLAAGQPRTSDIAIISATLEHIDNWNKALDNVFATTSKLIFLRSFFGIVELREIYRKKTAPKGYPIFQFEFSKIAKQAEAFGFSTRFLRDVATDSVPQYLGCGITRTQYLCLIKKI